MTKSYKQFLESLEKEIDKKYRLYDYVAVNDIKSFLHNILKQQAEWFVEQIEKHKKQDLSMEGGFHVTAEYRLGELRGGNQEIDKIRELLLSTVKEK